MLSFFLQIYSEHPLRGKEFYCDSLETALINGETVEYNVTNLLSNISTTMGVPSLMTLTNGTSDATNLTVYSTNIPDGSYGDGHGYGGGKYDRQFNEPNTALLSTILIFGTFLIAYFLRIFRNSRFLGRSVSTNSILFPYNIIFWFEQTSWNC